MVFSFSMPRRRPDRETPNDKKRKAHVRDMVIARYYGGDSYAKCWYYAHPESEAKPDSARVMGQREISWYVNTYPRESDQLIRQYVAKRRQEIREELEQKRKGGDPDNGSSEPPSPSPGLTVQADQGVSPVPD